MLKNSVVIGAIWSPIKMGAAKRHSCKSAPFKNNMDHTVFRSQYRPVAGAFAFAVCLAMSITANAASIEIEPAIVVSDNPANHVTPNNTGFAGVVKFSTNVGTCSGALLTGGRHIMTAAHCVTNGSGVFDVNNINVTFDNPSGPTVVNVSPVLNSNVHVNPNWTGSLLNGGDIAIIEMPVNAPADAEQYGIYEGGDEVGKVFTKVGYGRSGTGLTGDTIGSGTKRDGMNRYDALVDILEPGFFGVTEGTQLLYDFDNGLAVNDALGEIFGIDGLGLGDDEVLAAPGDSGGPNFIDGMIAGITSYNLRLSNGVSPDIDGTLNKSFGELGGDTRVSFYKEWIASILPATEIPAPGTLAIFGVGLLALRRLQKRR